MFSFPLAFGSGVEEQGRGSLHIHFVVWIQGFSVVLENLDSANPRTASEAKRTMIDLADNAIKTELFSFTNDRDACMTFNHPCVVGDVRTRKPPKVVSEQQLRNLHHKDGYKDDPSFAFCPECNYKWTYEELVHCYLENKHKICRLTEFPDKSGLLEA